jgi:hypothetical protein
MSDFYVRTYPPHFDAPLTKTEAENLVSNPDNVSRHPFFPFLQRIQHWTKYAPKGTKKEEVKEKTRPIRYASRRDASIFAYYRKLLLPSYERELLRLGLNECVLAYRRIPQANGKGGKCNIHFAEQAFKKIRLLGNCYTLAIDISQFFENLDHEQIRQMWWRLLEKPIPKRKGVLLPHDHFQVYKAVTQYSYIDRDKAYRELGLIGEESSATGHKKIKYLKSRKDFPKQICTPKEFREKLVGIIEHNPNPYGIPQGSPISDLLANLYMIDFDNEMNKLILSLGGTYYRYSDDILIIMPAKQGCWNNTLALTESVLKKTAARLIIKKEKTQAYEYITSGLGPDQINKILSASSGAEGLEYLGFRYDGKRIYLRNSTVSGIQRKITSVANRMTRRHIDTNPNMSLTELIQTFKYDVLISKFGRVKDFDNSIGKYKSWTFWTYVRRSAEILGVLGSPIMRQVGSYKSFARKRANEAIEYSYKHKRAGGVP